MHQKQQINIPLPKIFSFKACLSHLDRGFNDCLFELSDKAIFRLIQLSDGKAFIKITQKGNDLQVEISKSTISPIALSEVKNYVEDWLDLTRNIQPFYDLLEGHTLLNSFPEQYYGTRLIGIPDLFECICWCIIGQQINLTFAHKMKRNLVEKYGEKEIIDNTTYYLFPSPETLLQVDREAFVEMKFSRQKIDYLRNISSAFVSGEINKNSLQNCENKQERLDKLTTIKGIGAWTANYVLMKTMREMSCITYGDSGLNNAIHTLFKTEKKPPKSVIDAIFKDFAGWESYLNFYLWRSLK